MSKLLKILLITNLPILAYIFLLPFPHVPDYPGIRSTEPGDTVQVPNTKAFFTNDIRSIVMPFYYLNIKHPYIRLNHPPERAKTVIRDEIQSYYLEELVFPLKGSVYINGFEWKNDVFTKPEKRLANKMLVGPVEFDSKVTTRFYKASLSSQILNLLLLNIAILTLIKAIKINFYDKK